MSFTSASATTAGGHAGTIADPAWRHTSISLAPGDDPGPGRGFARMSADPSAEPSALSPSGRSFSVSYVSAGG
jgi:hypothetical protein